MSKNTKKAASCDIGVVGLGVMGRNFAYNLAGKGYCVAGYDLKPETVEEAIEGANDLPVFGCKTLSDFAESLKKPRCAIILVTAGQAVDSVITSLEEVFEADDIIMDLGNSYYKDTISREIALGKKGILYLGTGISGGEEGALNGPSIMSGGNADGWKKVEPMLRAASAKVDGDDCCAYVGSGGAGHFVKMIHNGIEYADMQLIAESYFLMKQLLCMNADEIADAFERWNKGELNSYLIEITVKVLRHKDESNKPLVDVILDKAGQKGTGIWASQEALALGVSAPSMAQAVFARSLSSMKEERTAASKILNGESESFYGDRDEWLEIIEKALYSFKICTYAQGFDLMKKASTEYGWGLRLGEIAKIWRGGCIIRAQFLNKITAIYEKKPELQNLLFDPYFSKEVERGLPSCRRLVAKSALCGVSIPCFSSALSYYDGLRSEFLPANLIQAQRDFFGAHTYQRLDRPGVFHTIWEE